MMLKSYDISTSIDKTIGRIYLHNTMQYWELNGIEMHKNLLNSKIEEVLIFILNWKCD